MLRNQLSKCLRLVVVVLALAALGEELQRRLPAFRDDTVKSGVRFVTRTSHTKQKYLIESMGGGVAIFDFDGDGWMDLFFVNGAKLRDPMLVGAEPDKQDPAYWNRLYRNNRDGTFTDVTERAGVRGTGYSMGVAAGDYDNDGRVDLYVTGYGHNTLYHNNGDGTFTDVTAKAGVAASGWSTSAGFFDYDRDGLLDLAVVRYLQWDFTMNVWCGDRRANLRAFCHPDVFRPATYLLFHNNGDGTFSDVSDRSRFGKAPGHGLGIAFNDSDGDGWPDIAVANDAVAQQLFHNEKNGILREDGLNAGIAFDDDGRTFSGMGIAFDDYDNDGSPDLVVTALANQKYALFRNRKGLYSYETDRSGMAAMSQRHSGWGVSWLDYDNDGWKDLFVAQGHVMDTIEQTEPGLKYKETALLARNINGKFEDVSATSGEPFREALAARGSAVGDLNNDGFQDLVIACNECGTKILMNEGGNGNHWLTVDTVGTVSNRDGLGARIHLVMESGKQQWGYVTRTGSYLSSIDKRVHFGVGVEHRARLLEVVWQSGTVQQLRDVAADQIIVVREPK
jgi:enediyne biosynthesis protein E4